MRVIPRLLICLAALCPMAAFAFNGEHYTVEPVTVVIGEVPLITETQTPVAVTVTVSNSSDAPLQATLRTRMTDGWRTQEPAETPLTIPAQGDAKKELHVICPADAYSALYPLHVTAVFNKEGKRTECHAVQIIETKLPPRPVSAEWQRLTLLDGGALNLVNAKSWRVRWQYFDGDWVEQPPNWQGSAEGSRASMQRGRSVVRGGVTRRVINMHPPWTGGVGTIMTVFKIMLPETPARLSFCTAIRDNTEKEPPSDGVLFRVWADDGTGPKQIFERFSDAKVWEPGEVDLSAYAGKTIELALESHPGPNRDTTCDSSYWGAPVIISGERPAVRTPEERAVRVAELTKVGRAVLRGEEPPREVHVFTAGEGEEAFACVISPGEYGLLDAEIVLVYPDRVLAFHGFRVSVNDERLGTPESGLVLAGTTPGRPARPLKLAHHFKGPDWNCDLLVTVAVEGDAIRFDFDCDERITELSIGAFDQIARRCYLGPGNVIEEPEYLRIGSGGHGLATSYFGCDFEGGVSLLQATTVPPDYCEARPAERAYPLVTHLNGSLTLVPSPKGCFDAALKLQHIWQPEPAGGVAKVAGKFVFDVWGGRYADIAEDMERAARYGLTDSMLIVHNWQRWGYDYRLPDIYPPNARYGSLEDMQRIGAVCRAHGILWGPHDNYIDFYPDAEGYSYDHICFTRDGRPVKAWINRGRDAQSYRWRPDHIQPFVERNLRLIKPNLKPTAYFIDVFSSIPVIDFYDRDGAYHSKLETQRRWGEAFAWIRDFLGGDAPQISEAGHDHLIGYLDGGQCQMRRITPDRQRQAWGVKCADWERTPWFNALWHDKFILHGVGYSNRYQGGLSFVTHGIYSDDYLSSEVLCGNPGMVRAGFGRGWVAKYWLIEPLMRSLALATMTGHEFAGDNLHRQTVTWSNGATVHVNRGEQPWKVAGHTLPQYGFYAEGDGVVSAVERIEGVRVAHAQAPDYLFVDARSVDPATRFPITVRVAELEYLGGRAFRIAYTWTAERPTDKEHRAFVHFCSDRAKRSDGIVFQGDHVPDPPTTRWQGEVRTETTVTLPEGVRPGEYDIRAGLYVPGGSRLRLRGPTDGSSRIKLGKVVVASEGEKITDIRFQPEDYGPPETVDFNRQAKVIDFGPVATNGAFRLVLVDGALVLTPLPEQPPAEVRLDLAKLFEGRGPERISRIVALDEDEQPGDESKFEQADSTVSFSTDGEAFAYRLEG